MRLESKIKNILGLLAIGIVAAACSSSSICPTDLKCEYLTDPSVVDNIQPRLSWINTPEKGATGAAQTAYRIIVSSSEEALSKDNGDLWDTGKVSSDESYLISYNGQALQSAEDCFWKVMVWDENDEPSSWSQEGKWSMGLLSESDWKAQWIGAPWQGEDPLKKVEYEKPMSGAMLAMAQEYVRLQQSNDPEDKAKLAKMMEMAEKSGMMGSPKTEEKKAITDQQTPAPLLRKSFEVKGDVASAKVFAVGLGYYEFYINGQKLGDEVLAPNETNYGVRPIVGQYGYTNDHLFRAYRVLYNSFDITDLLSKGENVAGAILGEGFYNATGQYQIPYGTSRLLAQIEITYKDGSHDTICSDPSWKAIESPILVNGVFEGEFYDSRKEIDGWATTSCDDSSWQNAILRKAPEGKLQAQTAPGDVVFRTYEPKSINKLEDGSYEVDFGTEITGWVRFKNFQGHEGDTLTVKYANDQQTVYDWYVFNGKKVAEYAPRFTWYTFTKAVVKGLDNLTADQMTAELVCADLAETGEFTSSNKLLEDINRIWKQSMHDNTHGGIASDCPQRERSGYTGDGNLSCGTAMSNFDAAAFYYKWIQDIDDSQNTATGHVPNIAPANNGAGGIAWGAAIDIMPWEFYCHYGDLDFLKKHYFAMTEYVRFMTDMVEPDGIINAEKDPDFDENCGRMFGSLGDWLPPFDLPDRLVVHEFFYYICTMDVAKAAAALGIDEDAVKYSEMAKDIQKAFHARFFQADGNTYGDYGANVFALRMGAVPEDLKPAVVETLRKEIVEKYNGHLNTGICGTRYILETLASVGLNDVAYQIMNQKDFPSFGWWLEQGATTTWEDWNGSSSHNHHMYGGCLTWLYEILAGVKYDENKPAYRHIIIEPILVDGLESVSYSNITPYGKVSSTVTQKDGKATLKVVVPVGSTATVIFGGNTQEVPQGEYTFTM